MSVEAQNTVEATPAPKTVDPTPDFAPAQPTAPETRGVTVGNAITSEEAAPAPTTEDLAGEGKTVVASYPASEGVLGYKEHGFLKSLRYTKHFFWLGDEASTAESLAHYLKNEKGEHVHPTAAWAQETGQGVLFYAKRAEDKATPAGAIILADATPIIKEGNTDFSFTVGKLHHRFQAGSASEADSWIVAIENKIESANGLKSDVTGRDSYKKTIEGFGAAGSTPATVRSSSKGPKKSLDAATVTAAASQPAANPETASTSSSDAEKKAKKAEKNAKKERSQSRKRASIFGMLGKKDEDKELKKEEKAEKKIEKEHLKEEKKIEAEQKKEEAKATHDSSKAVEAAEAAAVAAVPAAAIAAAEKKEDKKEDEVVSPTTEKKNKRASVFGSLFGKKGVTSPSTEKTEKEIVSPVSPVKDSEIPPVSETAPKLDEPIENKPIDTAAVTAPVDTITTPAATTPAPVEEPAKETVATPTAETTSTPKTEKKGGFLGFIKKAETKKEEKKEEKQEEKAAEQAAKDPVAAAAVTTDGAADVPAETTPVDATDAKTEERPAREKRRTSFFGALGTIKKKNTETSDSETTATSDVKREKSPLPAKLGGLFRKPSKAVKPTETEKPAETAAATEAVKTETVATEATEPAANTTIIEPTDSKIVGDVVPGSLVHDAVTTSTDVKTTA